MSVKTYAVCDVCGAQEEIKHAGPLSEYEYAKELGYIGWWQREDAFKDVCPNHPSPVVS